jgi:transglutaminase-like putative cysteine protease
MSSAAAIAAQPIPRVALTWLLVAQAVVIIPHLEHLPLWIVVLWLGCALWRVQVFRMRARFPSNIVKFGLVAAAGLGVWLSRGSVIGLDAGIVLLIAAFVIKLLELRTRRDAWVLILLGFFAVTTSYLFQDDIIAAAFSLLPVLALLAAAIGLQQSGFAARPMPTLRLAGGLLLQALPLMLLMFLLFPRMEPLWSLPMPGGQAVTGLSDSMAPGDMVSLSQSPTLAFRVSFDGQPPPHSQLYWRAMTLERFDGMRWTAAFQRGDVAPQWRSRGDALNYQVIMEPSGRPWLFALDVAQSPLAGARLMSDFHLEGSNPVRQALLYRATSWPRALLEPTDGARAQRLNLALPRTGNPQARAWAQELRARYPQPDELVQGMLRHFREQPFSYTLRPPDTGPERIDGFLFTTRAGFCEHYAGAAAFVLRAAGIPARVVTGYQGGEASSSGSYLSVRQFDAHAWVEYWQDGKGWTRVDPTGAVSPERIEQGLEAAVGGEGSFLEQDPFSPLRYRNISIINELRAAWDNLNYNWQASVLGYQGEQQGDLLQRWFGDLDRQWLGALLVGGGGLLLGLLALLLFKPWRRSTDPQLRSFQRFERLLAPLGIRREPAEGAQAFCRRAIKALPAHAPAIRDYLSAFEAQRYGGAAASSAELHARLARLRRELPWRLRISRGNGT